MGVSILDLAETDLDEVQIKREWNYIDLLIVHGDFVVAIENKVESDEHSDQLARYEQTVEAHFTDRKKVYIYLTPDGREARESKFYINIGYVVIAELLTTLLEHPPVGLAQAVRLYVTDYVNNLYQQIMTDSNLTELAKRIYRNHRELFEFVEQHRPNEWDEFGGKLRQLLTREGWIIGSKNKGFVRFLPPELDSLVLRYNQANGWPDKEAFLFEFDFYKGYYLTFRVVVSPGKGNGRFAKRLVEIITELPQTQKPEGEKWRVLYSKFIDWDLREMMLDWSTTQDDLLRGFIHDQKQIIESVTSALENHREELLDLKENN